MKSNSLSMRKWVCAAAVAAGVAGFASAARADMISFDLTTANLVNPPFAPDYATVTVNQTSTTTATITFSSLQVAITSAQASAYNTANPTLNQLTAGTYWYTMGDGTSAGVNVNANTWTLGAITALRNGSAAGTYTDGGSANGVSGFGSFNQTINNNGQAAKDSATSISFSLTNTSGTWANAAAVLKKNSLNGYDAVSHIFVEAIDANGTDGISNTATTGFAAGTEGSGTNPPPTPLPVSVAGGGVLFGMMGLRHWLRRGKVSA
jgi:hypothetical protein